MARVMTVRIRLPVLHDEPTNYEGTLLRQLVVATILRHPNWSAETLASYLVNDEFMQEYDFGEEDRMLREWGNTIEEYRKMALDFSEERTIEDDIVNRRVRESTFRKKLRD